MNEYLRRSPDVASRVIGEEAVLVRMPDSVLYALNASGARLWIAVDGTKSLCELAGGEQGDAATEFLQRMVGHGLLLSADAPSETADVFPQDVEAPPSDEPPMITMSEPVETLAGASCNQLGWGDGCGQPGSDLNIVPYGPDGPLHGFRDKPE